MGGGAHSWVPRRLLSISLRSTCLGWPFAFICKVVAVLLLAGLGRRRPPPPPLLRRRLPLLLLLLLLLQKLA